MFVSTAYAQVEKRSIEATRVQAPPKIDGLLEDSWGMDQVEAVKFYQAEPNNGEPASFDTKVRVLYTDYGIYIGARMYDDDPRNIKTELGARDDMGKNTDQFGVLFDTYNTGQNAFGFVVNASKVQSDVFLTPNDDDRSWDAVWKSAVSIDDEGWVVEMEIPFSAIRFPKKEEAVWGINFMRQIKDKAEESFWNFVDNSVEGFVNQSGQLTGLKNIKPPVRLFFNPFIAGGVSHDSGTDSWDETYSAGMDIKYGINESFTLDMSLIPDFSQVQSDNQVLNLSPFEVRFNENRPFFTEGTELFSKAGIFFSRRIGKSFGSVNLGPDEELIESPAEAPLINATKISGRTKGGLGIGVLNSMTGETEAKIRNTTTGEVRKEQVDPFTNFNVLVLDQALKNNSNIGLINTNVLRSNHGNNANVTAMDFRIFDKSNTFRVSGSGAISQVMTNDGNDNYDNDVGYSYNINLGKVSGKWQYNIGRNFETDNYNINDLGFLRSNNEISHRAMLSYNVFKPVGIWNRTGIWTGVFHNALYEPNKTTGWSINWETWAQLKNFWNYNVNVGFNVGDNLDYFDPRTEGYFIRKPWSFFSNFWLGTDGRKAIRISVFKGLWRRPDWEQGEDWHGANIRVRASNKLSFRYNLERFKTSDDRGFVTHLYDTNDDLSEVVYGTRDVTTMGNIISMAYTFNEKMNVNVRARHNWTRVKYFGFSQLNQWGDLESTTYTGMDNDGNPIHDTNFNAFNIDLVYTWQIAPGSFLNIVYKNAIISSTNDVTPNYFENFGDMITSDQGNSISLKVIYFIDYLSLKRKKK